MICVRVSLLDVDVNPASPGFRLLKGCAFEMTPGLADPSFN